MKRDGQPRFPMTLIKMNEHHQESTTASNRLNHTQSSSLLPLFKHIEEAFEESKRTFQKQIHYSYLIGNIPIKLRFLGSSLIPKITPALKHLLIEKTFKSELTIYLWDSKFAKIKFPTINREFREFSDRGDSWLGNTDRYNIFFQPSIGILSLLDKENGQAFFWVRDAKEIPYYESGAPLRMILHWWMELHEYHLLHAGAVATEKGGVLFIGKGGSGKSTTALACLSSKYLYAADDYCIVTTQPSPYVHSIFSSGKLNAEDINRFPEFLPALSNRNHLDTEKALYFFHDIFPKQITKSFPLVAILIPEVTNQNNTSIEKVSVATSYLALAPSTIFQFQDKKSPVHMFIGKLVKQVPSFRLNLGMDIKRTPNVIRELISGLHSA